MNKYPLTAHTSPCLSPAARPGARVLSENAAFFRKHIHFLSCPPVRRSPRSCLVWRQSFDRVETERRRLRPFAHLCVKIKVLCVKWGGSLCATKRAFVCPCTCDGWQQVCVSLCGGSGVQLTWEGGWRGVIAECSPLGSQDTSLLLRRRVQCARVHAHVCMCVSKRSDSADPAASAQLPPPFSLWRSVQVTFSVAEFNTQLEGGRKRLHRTSRRRQFSPPRSS